MPVTLITSSYSSHLTCPFPPAPDTTAPWRYATARRNSMPRLSVPTTAGRSLRCRRAGSWRRAPKGRRRRAGWGQPCPLPLCWPVRWTGTPGLLWKQKDIKIVWLKLFGFSTGRFYCWASLLDDWDLLFPWEGGERKLITELYLERFN